MSKEPDSVSRLGDVEIEAHRVAPPIQYPFIHKALLERCQQGKRFGRADIRRHAGTIERDFERLLVAFLNIPEALDIAFPNNLVGANTAKGVKGPTYQSRS